MKKMLAVLCITSLLIGVGATMAVAAKPDPVETRCSDGRDNDGDGLFDCDDPDCAADEACLIVNPDPEICDDTIDNDGDGLTDCADSDCSADPACTGGGIHADLLYQDYPNSCLGCHQVQFDEMAQAVHYRWLGEAPDMVTSPTMEQGKLTNAMNAYCINITGDWAVCGKCHTGRGLRPDDPQADLTNIDCLVCHSEEYALTRTRLADGSMGSPAPTDSMVRNIHVPKNTNCLKCHAYGGGANGLKRGDIAWELATNTDPHYDAHMNTAGANVQCIDCHTWQNHKVTGKGSDLRPTDLASEVKCVKCHTGMDSGSGHANLGKSTEPDRHVGRVACQSCHIPTYAKTATETHRIWMTHHDGSDATACSDAEPCPGHPDRVEGADLKPTYRFWNRLSENYLLGDDISMMYSAENGTYQTSVPQGNINDGKLYPFKYKTSEAFMTSADNRLIALDTYEYLVKSGNVYTSLENGLLNMGYPATEPYEMITTDTYQLINHGVTPSSEIAACDQCHPAGNLDPSTDSELDTLGYRLKGSQAVVCSQCHREKSPKTHASMHGHVSNRGFDCSFCHTFTRPERTGLCMPGDPSCDPSMP